MGKVIYFILMGLCLMIGGCGLQKPDELEKALERAGSNRIQLEGVLRHFEKDPQKYEVASYLIRNMPYHHTVNGPGLDDYRRCFRLFAEKRDDCFPEVDSMSSLHDGFGRGWSVINDAEQIDSIYLIHHIEEAFRIREEFPWCNNIADENFTRYVLPYRINNEHLTSWQDSVREKYRPLLESLVGANETDPLIVAQRVLDEWNKIEFKWTTRLPSGICLGLDNVINHSGACIDYAHSLVYLMRSFGIPSGIDYVPVRGQNNDAHYWPFMIDDKGMTHYSEVDSEVWHPAEAFDILGGKILREEFGLNREIMDDLYGEEECPDNFRLPLFSDVTVCYRRKIAHDLSLPERETDGETRLWLGVAHYRDWLPISYSSNEDFPLFEDVLGGVVYSLGEWKSGKFKPIGVPFEIDSISGKIRSISPDENVAMLTCFSKYPVDSFNGDIAWRVIGGVVEGSDSRDFVKSDTVFTIKELPKRKETYVAVANSGSHRYYRYRGVRESFCNIAELGFYEHYGDSVKLAGKIFGTPGSWGDDPSHTFEKAFDDDPDTSFDCVLSEGGEIGMDMGKPTRVEKILYAPRHRDNYVRVGDMYELFYYDDRQQWRSAGRQVAVSDSLDFEVPLGTLYYLKNHTRGKNERIFEYDFDKREQIFR